MEYENLIKEAIKSRKKAYAPYSNFYVGACLLCKNGNMYYGANIENAAFGPTVCAERVAFFEAVMRGERDFVAICVVGGKKDSKILDFCPPCGVCRQVMTEFCEKDFKIILAKVNHEEIIVECKEYLLEELMPLSFNL